MVYLSYDQVALRQSDDSDHLQKLRLPFFVVRVLLILLISIPTFLVCFCHIT